MLSKSYYIQIFISNTIQNMSASKTYIHYLAIK